MWAACYNHFYRQEKQKLEIATKRNCSEVTNNSAVPKHMLGSSYWEQ